ncbi:uncharacterized protein LOC111188803 [Astyanax mexicanus]|uniref:uncharacterized protein LOC111188803 n=1 Tax=Astyanax mexicanus TaxID=7994 RepID=UPI0020CB5924|nr:uncharacterized protein LOC111188803 [Astyanax mexicanus]
MASSIRWASGRLIEAEVADEMIGLINELIQEASNQHQPSFPGFTVPRRAGHVGRSVCQITQQQLQMLLSFNFSGKQIANILGVSRSTVKRRLRQYNLSFRGRYTTLSDEALDSSVLEIVSANDEIGPEAVRAQLAGEGILVQRLRVRKSVIRTNPEGAALRTMSHRLHRRTYKVAGPNSLWHVDGNHKLIRWRIVIHGGVDGYSRLVVFLQASNNNRSDTVMDLFIGAVSQYGVPSRVRCDHGGENNGMCLFMDIFQGSSRGSALRGRSTHNQRIERLWSDVWRGVTNVYYSLFAWLENEGKLDSSNEMHMWALHFVYLPRINRDLRLFINQWNHHKLRTAHMSPHQIFVQACLSQHLQHHTGIQGLFGADEQPEAEGGEAGAAAAEGGEAGAAAAEGGEAGAAAAEGGEAGAAAAEGGEAGAAAAEGGQAGAAAAEGGEAGAAAAEGGQAGAAAAEGGQAGAAAAEGGEARVPAFDWHQTVDVPVNRFILNGEQLEHIRQNINPLGGARDSLGTDIFEQILNYLS